MMNKQMVNQTIAECLQQYVAAQFNGLVQERCNSSVLNLYD